MKIDNTETRPEGLSRWLGETARKHTLLPQHQLGLKRMDTLDWLDHANKINWFSAVHPWTAGQPRLATTRGQATDVAIKAAAAPFGLVDERTAGQRKSLVVLPLLLVFPARLPARILPERLGKDLAAFLQRRHLEAAIAVLAYPPPRVVFSFEPSCLARNMPSLVSLER